jgi:hypothetical protein
MVEQNADVKHAASVMVKHIHWMKIGICLQAVYMVGSCVQHVWTYTLSNVRQA